MQLEDLLRLLPPGGPIDLRDFLGALGFSLLCSLAALWLYNAYYGSRHIGAGVHRFFLLGGPAITALFLAIQFSLPLSLGLLGALSIVRFRTPVKDPAEIGFILLLVAASIGSATFNYFMVLALYALAFVVLFAQRLAQRQLLGQGRSYLMITMEGSRDNAVQGKVSSFLTTKLHNVRLESISTLDSKTSMHFQFSRQKDFEWSTFASELERVAAPANISIFMN